MEKRTELSDLGEFGLIERLTSDLLSQHTSTLKGVGDDAAVIRTENGVLLWSTDMLMEGIHFDLSYTPLKHLGYKAVVANVSDICAMNGMPRQITVSLALSNRFSLESIEELYAGIRKACEIYKLDLVGGDTTSSVSGLGISISIIGEAKKEDVVYRSGASVNDLLVVTGDLGGAYMGLQILNREKSVYEASPTMQPDLVGFDYILERQLKPEARVDAIFNLRELGVSPTSMIDISDGLASEIFHLCKASKVGCNLYEDKLPLDPTTYNTARDLNLDPTMCALNGGEDYELLFTIKQSDFEKIEKQMDFTVIGHMTDAASGKMLITKNGPVIKLEAQGWDALKEE